jgi:CDP-paratose 2-epimerase
MKRAVRDVRPRPLQIVGGRAAGPGPVLITGGAGFVGCNLADRLLGSGVPVILFDNLSRDGVKRNLDWLRERHGRRLTVEIEDVRDGEAVADAVARSRTIFHLAAQVAVTTSVVDPVGDFETNVRGTLNVLNAMRSMARPPRLIFTSTNKVYGPLDDVLLRSAERSYAPLEADLLRFGIGEHRALDFHSPYGCSKGAADQYVLDFARSYGLETIVFRMSCIFGTHQCGTEDQGWVAHFLLRAIEGQPVTLYGDGRQVRDILYIDDLLDAFEIALADDGRLTGRAFNIGGGPAHAVSLLEVIDMISALSGAPTELEFDAWRPGDQRWYVSDIRRFARETGWRPRVTPSDGIRRLHDWITAGRPVAPRLRAAPELV